TRLGGTVSTTTFMLGWTGPSESRGYTLPSRSRVWTANQYSPSALARKVKKGLSGVERPATFPGYPVAWVTPRRTSWMRARASGGWGRCGGGGSAGGGGGESGGPGGGPPGTWVGRA